MYSCGEFLPKLSQNYISKVLTIEIEKSDINQNELALMKEHLEEFKYCIFKYIEYIVQNYEKVKEIILEDFEIKFQEIQAILPFETAKIIARKICWI